MSGAILLVIQLGRDTMPFNTSTYYFIKAIFPVKSWIFHRNVAVICMNLCLQQCGKLSYNIIALNCFVTKRKEYAANIFTGYVSYDYTLKNTKE